MGLLPHSRWLRAIVSVAVLCLGHSYLGGDRARWRGSVWVSWPADAGRAPAAPAASPLPLVGASGFLSPCSAMRLIPRWRFGRRRWGMRSGCIPTGQASPGVAGRLGLTAIFTGGLIDPSSSRLGELAVLIVRSSSRRAERGYGCEPDQATQRLYFISINPGPTGFHRRRRGYWYAPRDGRAPDRPRRHRRARFSRTLLVLSGAIVPCAYGGQFVRRALRQHRHNGPPSLS